MTTGHTGHTGHDPGLGQDPVLLQVVGDVLAADDATQEPEPGQALPPLWSTVGSLEWPAVGIPEDAGGAGGTLADLCAIVRLLGAHPVTVPLATAATAAWAAAAAGIPRADDAGHTLAVVALPRRGDTVTHHDGRLTGSVTRVPWGAAADRLLVAAGDTLALVDPDDAGARIAVAPGTNLAGEPRDTLTFDHCPVRATGAVPDGLTARAALLHTAALVGAVERAYALTVDHVTTRRQFGRPLAAFQAVAHGVATLACERAQARAALAAALGPGPGGAAEPPDPARAVHDPTRVAASRVVAGRAAGTTAQQAHQLHGAIGITQEHELHRYTTRLWSWRDELGTARHWTRRLGTYLAEGGSDRLWQWLTTP